MATKIITISLFFILTALSINFKGSSSSVDDQRGILPPISTLGRNTFGCLVNNVPVKGDSLLHATAFHQNNVLSVSIWLGDRAENQFVFVVGTESLRPGIHELNKPVNRYARFTNLEKDCMFSSDEYYNGVFMIHHIDLERSIISASFEFMAYAEDCQEIIKITDGRFDLKFSSAI